MYSNSQVKNIFQLIGALQQEPSEALQAVIRESGVPSQALQALIREEEERSKALQGLIHEAAVLQGRDQRLMLGVHEHKHGDSLYLFLVPKINEFGSSEFEDRLQEDFDPEREFLRVEKMDDPEVIRPKFTFKHTIDAYRELLEKHPGKVLLQNEHNVAFMLDGEMVGCTLINGEIVLDGVFAFDRSSFDDHLGGWSGAEEETVDYIEYPRFYSPKEGVSDQGLAAYIEATKTAASNA